MTDADSAPGFDTLAYARRLKDAGVDSAQADAHAEAARRANQGTVRKVDLDNLGTRIERKLASLETRLVRNIYGVAATQTIIILGFLYKLLP